MTFELPPNWVADHDQLEAELRDLVMPVVSSILAVRNTNGDDAAERGLVLAEELAERIGPMDTMRVTELLFLALTKIAHHAIEQYDERMVELHDQYTPGHEHAGGDVDGAEERERGSAEPGPEADA